MVGSHWLSILYVCCAYSLSRVWLFVTPWTVTRQASLSMGSLQARTLEWVSMPSSRGSSQPRDQTQVSHIAGEFFTPWVTREAHFICSSVYMLTPRTCMHAKSLQSCLTLCDLMDCKPTRLLCPWDSPGKNTRVGCYALLQEILPTQESNSKMLMSPMLAGGFFTSSATQGPTDYHPKWN